MVFGSAESCNILYLSNSNCADVQSQIYKAVDDYLTKYKDKTHTRVFLFYDPLAVYVSESATNLA